MSVEQMWDALIEMGVAEETLQVVTRINGYSADTMHDVLWAVFGERVFEGEFDE